ncbi:polyadenylate-binding protein 7-like isoform X2 [Vitis riparia]|uniref:polyadenylate-binding protein 7-like isoform X2 n=1 Tax=Vitis riparia TaxID=96939 RepID=UPI00155A797F|nr:polyadenylate-binding protein 7-like isoform X2 [Vitis riparia]
MAQINDLSEHAVKGSEVFVGGLSRTITESNIREVFSTCGEIIEVRMMTDQNGKSKGYCFVRFTTKEAANKAIKEKSGFMVEGKKIGVVPSTDQTTLFFGNLPKDWSPDEFDKMVCQAFQDVTSVDLAMPFGSGDTSLGQKQQNRGFAFVKFSSHAAAARAHRMGSKSDFLLGDSWHPVVEWAEEPEIDPEELAKITIAFVGNLPKDANEDYLKKLFGPFGKVEKVLLSKKGQSPVGFVHFAKRSDLDNAIKEMNEKTVQGPSRGPAFKLQVAVAKPLDRKRKRARDESQSKSASKMSNPVLLRSDQSHGSPAGGQPKAPKQKYLIEEQVPDSDPYEAAVVSLPAAVKERLLRILRLGIATRFDIDIQCITSLHKLPELAAISVLDQFMLSGADKLDKGAYLAGLMSKHQIDRLGVNRIPQHQVDKLGVNRIPLHLPRVEDTAPGESVLPSLSSRVHRPAFDSLASRLGTTAARYDGYETSPALSRYSTYSYTDYPLSRQLGFDKLEETSPTPLYRAAVSSSSYGRAELDPRLIATSVAPPARPQMRFDPFTGEPYKFDPFTGEPIEPDGVRSQSGSRY